MDRNTALVTDLLLGLAEDQGSADAGMRRDARAVVEAARTGRSSEAGDILGTLLVPGATRNPWTPPLPGTLRSLLAPVLKNLDWGTIGALEVGGPSEGEPAAAPVPAELPGAQQREPGDERERELTRLAHVVRATGQRILGLNTDLLYMADDFADPLPEELWEGDS